MTKKNLTIYCCSSEVLPGATSALTLTTTGLVLDRIIQQSVSSVPGIPAHFSACTTRVLHANHHQVFYNVLDFALQRLSEDKINATIRGIDYSIFGHDVRPKSHSRVSDETLCGTFDQVTRPEDILNSVERRGIMGKSGNFYSALNAAILQIYTLYWNKYGWNNDLPKGPMFNQDALAKMKAHQILDTFTDSIETLVHVSV